MITVYVGEEDINVYISVTGTGPAGFITGGVREDDTDSEGYAYIDFSDLGDTYEGKIVVNGETIYEGFISDGETYYA